MRTDKPGQVEVWLARQAIANATMDLPDVDGFMERFGDALLRAVSKISPGAAMANFADVPKYGETTLCEPYIARSYSKWVGDALANARYGNQEELALARIFTEWMSGGLKSKHAREFIINTCYAAMAAGV